MLFSFSRDFVLEFSRLFSVAYIRRRDFIHLVVVVVVVVERAENVVVKSERLIDRVKKNYCFFCVNLLWIQ